MSKALVLLSGGIDSAVVLASVVKGKKYEEVVALSFDYGQHHSYELQMANRLARDYGVRQHEVHPLASVFTGGLVGIGTVPRNRTLAQMDSGVAPSFVPGRNLVFLSVALSYAYTIGAHDVYIGVNASDNVGYPDCRPAFISAFRAVAKQAFPSTKDFIGFDIHTPLIALTKNEIVKWGLDLGVDFSHTSTCYTPDYQSNYACGTCDACTLRLAAFKSCGTVDPIAYQEAQTA